MTICGVGYILDNFFTKSAGHPGCNWDKKKQYNGRKKLAKNGGRFFARFFSAENLLTAEFNAVIFPNHV
jgi:hypothetical protein